MKKVVLLLGFLLLVGFIQTPEPEPNVIGFEHRSFRRYSTAEPMTNGQVGVGTITAEVWVTCDRWGHISDVPLIIHFHTQQDRPDLYAWRTVHSNTYADCGDDGDRIASWQQRTFPGYNAIHAHGPNEITATAWWCGEGASCDG